LICRDAGVRVLAAAAQEAGFWLTSCTSKRSTSYDGRSISLTCRTLQVVEAELLQLEIKECKDCLDLTGLFLADAFFRHGGTNEESFFQRCLFYPMLLQ